MLHRVSNTSDIFEKSVDKIHTLSSENPRWSTLYENQMFWLSKIHFQGVIKTMKRSLENDAFRHVRYLMQCQTHVRCLIECQDTSEMFDRVSRHM
jgi:hypothetical protein